MDEHPRPLTTREAARLLGVHLETLRRAVRRGEIPALRLGRKGHFRLPLDALERATVASGGGPWPAWPEELGWR